MKFHKLESMNTGEGTSKFKNWKAGWSDPGGLGVMDYISHQIHPEDFIITSELLFPSFREVEEGLYWNERFDEKAFEQWKDRLGNNTMDLEKVVNHLHIYDLFDGSPDDISEEVFVQAGQILRKSWQLWLDSQFPDRKILVELSVDEGEYGPTLYVFQM